MHHERRRQPPTSRPAAAMSGASAVRAASAWALDAYPIDAALRPSVAPVFVAIARAVVAPSADTFDALASALAAWCQSAVAPLDGAEAPAYPDEVTAPLMARAVDVAALAGQAALDAESIDPEDMSGAALLAAMGLDN